jgi:hypothetical protein
MKDFKKMPKMADGGSVAGEPRSNYYGYVGETRDQRAQSAKKGFDTDYEGSKRDYLKGKSKGDPTPEQMSSRLGNSDEEAAGILSKAHRKTDKSREEVFKLRRDLGMKKGGKATKKKK